MLVKIVKGTYGYRPNPDEVRVIRKDSQSSAFELNDKEAERLISLGVAKRCNAEVRPDHKETLKSSVAGLPDITAEDIASLEFNDLRKVAKAYGLDTKGTKEDLILRLKSSLFPAYSKDDEPDEDEEDESKDASDETLPEFEAREPVV